MNSPSGDIRSIPLSRPWFPTDTGEYLSDVISGCRLGAFGRYGTWCETHLEEKIGCGRVLMTNSGSSALDAACFLAGLTTGDEVIVPSFAFASAASAVLKCGATPVFVDIEPKHLTIDCAALELAISARTKAVISVDYGGMPCDYERLTVLAGRHGFVIIEDAAHAFDAWHRGKALGTFGVLGTYSFHQTKNISCGEGGALLVNDPTLYGLAEQLCDKGTNRREMMRGLVPFYEWVAIGAGIGLSEPSAAILRPQFEQAAAIREARRQIFNRYSESLARLDECGAITLLRPVEECDHNAHLVAFLAADGAARGRILGDLNARGIGAAFHYAPLHSSKAGRALGRNPQGCPVTEDVAGRIVRLPIYFGLSNEEVEWICGCVAAAVVSA